MTGNTEQSLKEPLVVHQSTSIFQCVELHRKPSPSNKDRLVQRRKQMTKEKEKETE